MFDWLPNWQGQTCVIVAAGPSAITVNLGNVCSKAKVIAINNSWRLVPLADMIYAADGKWWSQYHSQLRGLPALKVTVDKGAARKLELNLVELVPGCHALSMDQPGRIGIGGNSGFHAFNIAAQCYPSRIGLVGFDMTTVNGSHWHGDHARPLANPREFNMERWRRILDEAKPVMDRLGIEVVNCSEPSSLQAYPKVPLSEFLQ